MAARPVLEITGVTGQSAIGQQPGAVASKSKHRQAAAESEATAALGFNLPASIGFV